MKVHIILWQCKSADPENITFYILESASILGIKVQVWFDVYLTALKGF